MKRQAAFENAKQMLKGALHCHTTRSDGAGTPEDVMRLHAENGYNFMAITDHQRYNYTNYAPDTNITLIPGMEIGSDFDNEKVGFRCFHSVCLGPNNDSNGFTNDEYVSTPNVKDQFEFQKYLDNVHSKNNITFYCHPEWSSTPTRYFEHLEGIFAMEVWNSGCVMDNDMDYNAPYWDEMLGLGHKIWGVAVDDGHPMNQHCKGWVMVNAENNVDAILDALLNGRFYSSTGPVIKDFYVLDGVAHVEAEEGSTVIFCSDKHPARKVIADNGHAETGIGEGYYDYIRAVVKDKDGNRAWTNPIFFK